MFIEIPPEQASEPFVDYLRRLGCTLTHVDEGRLSVSVTYPETVDDEAASIREWCESWSQARRIASAEDDATAH